MRRSAWSTYDSWLCLDGCDSKLGAAGSAGYQTATPCCRISCGCSWRTDVISWQPSSLNSSADDAVCTRAWLTDVTSSTWRSQLSLQRVYDVLYVFLLLQRFHATSYQGVLCKCNVYPFAIFTVLVLHSVCMHHTSCAIFVELSRAVYMKVWKDLHCHLRTKYARMTKCAAFMVVQKRTVFTHYNATVQDGVRWFSPKLKQNSRD